MPSVIKMDFSSSLGFEEQADHGGIYVNAVTDDFRKKGVVIQNVSCYAGVAMVQAAHGVEGMGGAARASAEAGLGLHQGGVTVTQAAHHAQATGVLDQLERRGQLGRDGQDADMPASSLPETIEQRYRRLHQQSCRCGRRAWPRKEMVPRDECPTGPRIG